LLSSVFCGMLYCIFFPYFVLDWLIRFCSFGYNVKTKGISMWNITL